MSSSRLPLRLGYAAILLERLPKQDLSSNQEYAPPGTRSWVAQVVGFLREIDEMTPLLETVERAELRCEKCGSEDVRTAWHKSCWPQRKGCLWADTEQKCSEHLHRYCQVCGFDWADVVLAREALGA